MKVTTLNYPGRLNDMRTSGRTVIIVDTLRASTCIVWAVKNGAEKVIPIADPGDAATMHLMIGGECILAGERGGIKVPGFDIGNSPLDFTASAVRGKTVIICTTNGTNAICAVKNASSPLIIGAMINKSAVARRAVELGNDVLILCAGTDGRISADDICTAGAIAEGIYALRPAQYEQDDMTFMARTLYADHAAKRVDLAQTAHWSRLLKLGFAADVNFCFTEDITDVVPELVSGIIRCAPER
ncbi:MAG: 2-phosphosulfolactate phosphatase [Clostridia bacterium]|nr:2-phosphosulfolactate phosphatase [Clostridia bacterium]